MFISLTTLILVHFWRLLFVRNLLLLLDHHSRVGNFVLVLILEDFTLCLVVSLIYFLLCALRMRSFEVKALSLILAVNGSLILSKCTKSWVLFWSFRNLIFNQRQIVWSSMLDTKLWCISLAINYLWIIIVSLSLNLLSIIFVEYTALSLMHAHHISIDWRSLIADIRFISFKLIFLSRCNHRFLWICRTYIVFLMSFSACNPVHRLGLLITNLDHLLGLHQVLMRCKHRWF